jgi:heme-degrading monooxygenase HmoA
MPEISETSPLVTQITRVKLQPDTQQEVIDLMTERARFMATQPGFVSVSLHRSQDGSHLVNYIQWKDRKQLGAAHHAPAFRRKWPRFGELVSEVDPGLYEVVHIEEYGMPGSGRALKPRRAPPWLSPRSSRSCPSSRT